MNRKWSSGRVRDTFLNYFIKNPGLPHVYVPSSSIVPKKHDRSLAFVNAGMNQFKDVILGYGRPVNPPRATNTQKCIRINDLSLVGRDTFHHSFFEMMGNWSFADYFKKECISMALDLLTNTTTGYGIDPNRLYVTYFAGSADVPMDVETKEIWKQMGIPEDRILPFEKENFWSMGQCGPCGPSTEIHYDHRGVLDPSLVNKDDGSVVEVWNLVFMQYNRMNTGSLERLPLSHVVDTGAGLERLTAVLNGKMSNYDTDLFMPIFEAIEKLSKTEGYKGNFSCERDTSYRVVSDHIRAITVALSDGILPQQNHKIRRLVHRMLSHTQKDFLKGINSKGDDKSFEHDSRVMSAFVKELVNCVVSILGPVFPEMERMKNQTAIILSAEVLKFLEFQRTWKQSRREHGYLPETLLDEFPALSKITESDIDIVKGNQKVDGSIAFKWYESHGVSMDALEELCSSLNLSLDKEGLRSEFESNKSAMREQVDKDLLFVNDPISSDDAATSSRAFKQKIETFLYKHNPNEAGGIFQADLNISDNKEEARIVWMFDDNGNSVNTVKSNSFVWVVFAKTPFIPGGDFWQCDLGEIVFDTGCKGQVTDVTLLPSGWILHRVQFSEDVAENTRLHLKSFRIQNERRFGRKTSSEAIMHLRAWLTNHFKVARFDNDNILSDRVESELTILEHAQSSANMNEIIQNMQRDLQRNGIPIVVTKFHKRQGSYFIECATGLAAEKASRHGKVVEDFINGLPKDKTQMSSKGLQDALKTLNNFKELENPIPFLVSSSVDNTLAEFEKNSNKIDLSNEMEIMAKDIQIQLDSDPHYVLKLFNSDFQFSSLKKLTRVVEKMNKPVFILVKSSDNTIQGRCVVPEGSKFSASEWVDVFVHDVFQGSSNKFELAGAPKGQNPEFTILLKKVKMTPIQAKALEQGVEKANLFAQEKTWLKQAKIETY